MKIILFIDSLGAGGAQRQLVGLAVLLKNKGYDVKVSTYHDIDFYKKNLDDNNVPNELISGASNTKKRIWCVRQYFKKEQPDCVIAYQETPSLVACVAKILGCNFKIIVSERNTTQQIGISDHIRFFLYRWSNWIVPNSYSQGAFITSHYPNFASKVEIVSNFVDLIKFSPEYRERNVDPLILIAATVWPPKNTINFIKCVAILKDRGCKFKIEWYGIPKTESKDNILYQEKCNHLISELGLNDVFSLLPKTQSIAEKYKDADYFCLPSLYEGTPNVICEAMASGKPIICSDVCDNSRYVKEGLNGFLFDPNSPENMANKIQEALEMDDNSYQTYCHNSRELAENLCSESVFVDKYLDLIEK